MKQSAAGAGAIAIGGAEALKAQLVYRTSDWNVGAFDAVLKAPARIKQAYDIIRIGEGKFLNNIKNSLNGLHFGFGIAPNQIKIVAALHGPVNMLNFDNAMWEKYQVGKWLDVKDPKTDQPATQNIFYPSKAGKTLQYSSTNPDDTMSAYQDTSIQGLQARGVQFLSCHTAMEEQARAIVERLRLQQSPEEVVHDLLAHTLPGVLVVASMVAAIALLQTEGHYSYITV